MEAAAAASAASAVSAAAAASAASPSSAASAASAGGFSSLGSYSSLCNRLQEEISAVSAGGFSSFSRRLQQPQLSTIIPKTKDCIATHKLIYILEENNNNNLSGRKCVMYLCVQDRNYLPSWRRHVSFRVVCCFVDTLFAFQGFVSFYFL